MIYEHIYELNDIISFGKYKGMTIKYIKNNDISYLEWCKENIFGFTVLDSEDIKKLFINSISNLEKLLVDCNFRDKIGMILQNTIEDCRYGYKFEDEFFLYETYDQAREYHENLVDGYNDYKEEEDEYLYGEYYRELEKLRLQQINNFDNNGTDNPIFDVFDDDSNEQYYEKFNENIYFSPRNYGINEDVFYRIVDFELNGHVDEMEHGIYLFKLPKNEIKILGESKIYFIFGNKIFYNNSEIEGADADSFKIIELNYSRDKNNIFYKNKSISNVDLNTFEIINEEYSRDKNSVYYLNTMIEGVNPINFIIINDSYFKDNNNIYTYCIYEADDLFLNKKLHFEIMNGIDPLSFEIINEEYSKDKNNVYYLNRLISNVDVNTFEIINEEYSKDMYNVYSYGNVVCKKTINENEVIDIKDIPF